jgi:hypothetical protein
LNALVRFRLSKAALSAAATSVGIVAGIVMMRVAGWKDLGVCAFMISLFAVPVWLLILLPVSVWLPPSSRLWHPFVCAPLGAVAGAAMLVVYFLLQGSDALDLAALFAPVGAIVGGVTCLVGSITARYLHGTQPA